MTCNASILPHVPMNFTGSTSFQVTLQYNVIYNLSVEGKALCGENRITHMELQYGELFIHESIDIDSYCLCSQLWLSIAINRVCVEGYRLQRSMNTRGNHCQLLLFLWTGTLWK